MGRKWTAWFSLDIPISDGPYKFRGLPGLIIFLYEDNNKHNFLLLGNEVLIPAYSYPTITETSTSLTLEKYKRLFNTYRSNPAASIRLKYATGKIPNQKDSNGNLITGLQVVERIENY